MRKMLLAFAAAGAMIVSGSAFAADYKIMAPAAPGGGWDQTARTIQSVLQDEKISGSVAFRAGDDDIPQCSRNH